jgi:hypothetical protein
MAISNGSQSNEIIWQRTFETTIEQLLVVGRHAYVVTDQIHKLSLEVFPRN